MPCPQARMRAWVDILDEIMVIQLLTGVIASCLVYCHPFFRMNVSSGSPGHRAPVPVRVQMLSLLPRHARSVMWCEVYTEDAALIK